MTLSGPIVGAIHKLISNPIASIAVFLVLVVGIVLLVLSKTRQKNRPIRDWFRSVSRFGKWVVVGTPIALVAYLLYAFQVPAHVMGAFKQFAYFAVDPIRLIQYQAAPGGPMPEAAVRDAARNNDTVRLRLLLGADEWKAVYAAEEAARVGADDALKMAFRPEMATKLLGIAVLNGRCSSALWLLEHGAEIKGEALAYQQPIIDDTNREACAALEKRILAVPVTTADLDYALRASLGPDTRLFARRFVARKDVAQRIAEHVGELRKPAPNYKLRSEAMQLVGELIDAGADVNAWCMLGAAASMGDVESVSMLLDKGADPGRCRSILHEVGAGQGIEDRRRIFELLVDSGADVDAQDSLGRTALWNAVWTP